MPRARRRPKPVRGEQHCQSDADHPSARPERLQLGSPGTRVRDPAEIGAEIGAKPRAKIAARIPTRRARRYTIEIRDAETGDAVILAAADWTAEQMRLGVALISRLSGLPAARRIEGSDEDPPKRGKTAYH